MSHLTALRNSILCGAAIVAVAGCGATRLPGSTSSSEAGVPAAPAAGSPASTTPATGDGSIDQQLNSIDNQLNTIDGQMNAAGSGLSTSEGDPTQ
jgi:hypothetical protein